MPDTPLTDQQLAARIAEVIRPRMLIGLQVAELHDAPGTERINEWADSIANWAAEVMQPELDRLRAERDQARTDAFNEAIGRFKSLANLAPDSKRAPGINFAIGALMSMRDYPARTAGES